MGFCRQVAMLKQRYNPVISLPEAIFPPIYKLLLIWAGFCGQRAMRKQVCCPDNNGFPALLQISVLPGGNLRTEGNFETRKLPCQESFSRPNISYYAFEREFGSENNKLKEKTMKQELLTPNISLNELQLRLKELTTLYKKLKTPQNQQITGKLRVTHRGKYVEYYHITSDTSRYGKYLSKKHLDIATQLAQKEYNSQIIALLEEEISALKTYLTTNLKLDNYYKDLCPARQKLITPLTLTDEQYAAQWKTTPYKGLPFAPDATAFTTLRHERVRSKSEVLIANALTQSNIPYRYEYPLTLKKPLQKGTTTFYPDFLCLNLRTRQEFIWEHFGLIDSPEYAQNAASKLNLYAQNQILPGRNLIITMETATEPLTPIIIEQTINVFLR